MDTREEKHKKQESDDEDEYMCGEGDEGDEGEESEYDSDDEVQVSAEDQTNDGKYFLIPQNVCDLSFERTKVQVKDISTLQQEPCWMSEYKDVEKLLKPCLGKTHVCYSRTGDYWNNTAMNLLRDEDNEDGIIFGDVILFVPPASFQSLFSPREQNFL